MLVLDVLIVKQVGTNVKWLKGLVMIGIKNDKCM